MAVIPLVCVTRVMEERAIADGFINKTQIVTVPAFSLTTYVGCSNSTVATAYGKKIESK